MDASYSGIIYKLVKNPRQSLRSISNEMNISAQDLNYRLKRIKEEGIIKKYMIHVNPSYYGKKSIYMAFSEDRKYKGNVSSLIKCLEKTTVYGISGNENELREKSKEMIDVLGSPEMIYTPKILDTNLKRTKMDDEIIEQLKIDPMMKTQDIAKAINRKTSIVEKRLDYLLGKKIVSIIPKLDLSKLNTVLIAVFTDKINSIIKKLDESLMIINDEQSGIALSIEKNLMAARKVIENLREAESKIEVMIIYDYEFFE